MSDWRQDAKVDYLAGGVTCRQLAEKYGKTYSAVSRICAEEHWRDLRRQTAERATEAAMEKAAVHQARRMSKMQQTADRLMEKVDQAVGELDIRLVKNRRRDREIRYENPEAPERPTGEVIREEEEILQTTQTVDRVGVKQLASAMRDLKELQMLRSEEELREHQARIALLEQQAAKLQAEEEGAWVQVCFDADAEDCAD